MHIHDGNTRPGVTRSVVTRRGFPATADTGTLPTTPSAHGTGTHR